MGSKALHISLLHPLRMAGVETDQTLKEDSVNGKPATSLSRGDTSWFVHDRLGMFIHWGLYSLGARGEWLQHDEMVRADEYENRYLCRFDPDLFDPDTWARIAANAGMKYVVMTTKHHDGFCLWDSSHTDYKITRTPFAKDIIGPIVEAFRARGMRIGFYHSLIDWHHPDYVVDPYIGPLRDHPSRAHLNEHRDQTRYAEYLHRSVRELLTRFGRVDILWFDYSFKNLGREGKGSEDWRSQELCSLVRHLMPNVVLNDRLDADSCWDVQTPEQYQPSQPFTVAGKPVVWEACHTFNGSWGYSRDELNWKSPEMLVQLLIDSVSKDGNLLLNVGPTGRGEIDERTVTQLGELGNWMYRHGRSIYGCTCAPSEFNAPLDCRLTYNSGRNRLYLHIFAWPFKYVHLTGKAFVDRVVYAQLLDDASEVPMGTSPVSFAVAGAREEQPEEPVLTLTIPVQRPKTLVPVVELFLR